ncbi:hypothetical protein OIU83_00430 [Flavobacterium sp. LS1R49]|uniref:Uncharacterized protein n=1 Tax=Flavobacterium shii TaxID=2987687 RepID=A0A9X2YT37_9FLAO|nr:hypothetical protein [Flavobacterium shii]MCV9926104.1 hypothetical protein [Flavobacterium shii]
MSNFKIIGNPNPETGKEVTYTVSNSNLPGSLFPGQVIPLGSNPFLAQVQWSLSVLEYGKWKLKEKNNKTGPKAAYTFTEISLTRQAIRIVARMGEEKATLDIKPQKTVERKIIGVELCDALGKKQTKPFAYNQTVLARVHCLNLDNCTVHVTLWEDDAPGKGHSEINKNNKAVTKSELISNGIADIKFRLATDFAKMANAQLAKGDKSEGKFHEYYVTAEIFRQKIASSNNINVINPDNKTPDAKPKPIPSRPTPQKPKPPVPAATKGKSQMEEKGILETVGSAIYDWGESKLKVLSTILPDPMEIVNSVSKLATPDKKEEKKDEKKGTCPNCDKDITLDEIKKICVDSKGNCLIDNETMIKAALPHLNKYRKKVGINTCVRKAHFLSQIAEESKFYSLQENFNWYWKPLIGTFSSYFIQFNSKDEKETEAKRLGRANEAKTPGLTLDQQIKLANAIYGKTHPNGKLHVNSGDGWLYSGKGFKQITWKSNYQELEKYFNANMKIDNESDVDWTDGDNPYKLKNNAKDAMTSALAFWGKNNINSVANENNVQAVEKVTKKINTALKGLEGRKKYFKNAVDVLKVNNCQKGSSINIDKGTVIIVSGKDTKKEKDPAQNIYWVMYKTSVYKDMSLQTYKKLLTSKKLPEPDHVTYLSRDTHQTYSKKKGSFKHSDKRFGQYNEIPPGEYFLVPGLPGQTYKIYVIDSESKTASDENGISGVDGPRGGVALHQYCPRFSVGCFTFNCGTSTSAVTNFINEIPDLVLNDGRPVRFIVEERKVTESTWDDAKKGTKKWTGI